MFKAKKECAELPNLFVTDPISIEWIWNNPPGRPSSLSTLKSGEFEIFSQKSEKFETLKNFYWKFKPGKKHKNVLLNKIDTFPAEHRLRRLRWWRLRKYAKIIWKIEKTIFYLFPFCRWKSHSPFSFLKFVIKNMKFIQFYENLRNNLKNYLAKKQLI